MNTLTSPKSCSPLSQADKPTPTRLVQPGLIYSPNK
jgi:hypothetical protein